MKKEELKELYMIEYGGKYEENPTFYNWLKEVNFWDNYDDDFGMKSMVLNGMVKCELPEDMSNITPKQINDFINSYIDEMVLGDMEGQALMECWYMYNDNDYNLEFDANKVAKDLMKDMKESEKQDNQTPKKKQKI